MQRPKTIKVTAPVTEDNPAGYVVINEDDYDAETHELHEGEETPANAFAAMGKKDLVAYLKKHKVEFESDANLKALRALCAAHAEGEG